MHVWALGLWCETPAASGPPGLHTTTRELQTCTFERPALPNHQKSTRRPPEREKNSHFAHSTRRVGFAERNTSSTSCELVQLADCLPMVHQRHPVVAATLVAQLSGNPETRYLSGVREAKHELAVAVFEPPSWQAIACGARPARREPEDHEPGTVRRGWQHVAASVVEEREVKALTGHKAVPGPELPSQQRQLAGNDHPFPLVSSSLASQTSSAASPRASCMPMFGHHRAACPRAGVLSRRGFSLESAAARICREAGGRVRTNACVRDLDVPGANAGDGRRLEVVVDGLPLFGGWQLAMVCALHGDGRPRRGAAEMDGVEETDFGQSRFGQPDLTNFGQSNLGQSQFWPIQFWPIHCWPIHCWPIHLDLGVCHGGPQRVWGQTQKKVGPRSDGPTKEWAPKGGEAQNFALFSVSRPHFRSFCLSLGVFTFHRHATLPNATYAMRHVDQGSTTRALTQPLAHHPPLGRWCEPCHNHPPRGTVTVPHKTCSQTAMQHDLLQRCSIPATSPFVTSCHTHSCRPLTILLHWGSTPWVLATHAKCIRTLPSLPWHTETEPLPAALRPSIVETSCAQPIYERRLPIDLLISSCGLRLINPPNQGTHVAGAALDLMLISSHCPCSMLVHSGLQCCVEAPGCCPIMGSGHYLCVASASLIHRPAHVQSQRLLPLRNWPSTLLRAYGDLCTWSGREFSCLQGPHSRLPRTLS